MTQIIPGGLTGSVGGGPTAKAGVMAQLEAMASMLRQLGGDARVVRGSTEPTDPLVAPFTLYVNPYIGSDRFVAGAFNEYELATGTDEQKIAAKLKRVSNQALSCGYSPSRPFKTINRAAIEAAIITSRAYYTFKGPNAQLDCVLIRVSAGRHTVYNDPGPADGATITAWADGFDPAPADLIKFNDPKGGLLLPRGASFNGDDLRKTVFAYNWAPPPADELPDYSNRSAIYRVTPLALGGQFTFVDKIGQATSVHLLDCVQNVSKAQLDRFYAKALKAVGAGANLSAALTVTRKTEYQVVGPIQGTPAPEWDTTASASPYMFNCSIRSDWGLCGVFLDGDNTEGLDSLVTAQFTGVCLQKDMNCWEIYNGGNWITPTYQQYVDAEPDNVRMKPARRSRHLTVVNDAFVQAVSVFCIGQGVGYFTDNGGEITVTNSNSSFGGCAALSKGYKRAAFPRDKDWTVSRIKVPRTVEEKKNNVKKIFLGKVSSLSTAPHQIVLDVPLDVTLDSSTTPELLSQSGYTFRAGTYVWIENNSGPDYRATFPAAAWSSATPGTINLTAQPVDSDNGTSVLSPTAATGRRVYIRRINDTRKPEERRVTLLLENSTAARIPERNFILQTDTTKPAITRALNTTSELLLVTKTGSGGVAGAGVNRTAEISLRRGAPAAAYTNNTYYLKGTVVRSANKHWQCVRNHVATAASPAVPLWIETFVHMPSAYDTEEPTGNEIATLAFDNDTGGAETSTTLGINWATVYTADTYVRDQYRASTDYRGAHAFLVAMGLSANDAHTALLPRVEASRLLDPSNAASFPVAPSGGAAAGRGNWPVEFRRPSILRLYGHAWEWAGWLNYSKSIPGAQRNLSSFNKFTYYFTNEAGGRVVPQGSNEDGFNVSPRGLEDIETGTIISTENLEAPDIDLPTFDKDVSIENLTVTGVLDLSGVTTLLTDPDLFPYLPFVGANNADIILRSLGIGQAPETGFKLALNGSAKGNVIALGTGTEIDCRLGNYFTRAVAGNVAFTFTNPPATGGFTFTLEVAYTSGALTLPASIRHIFGIAPALLTGRTYQFICTTINGGARWNVVTLEFPTA